MPRPSSTKQDTMHVQLKPTFRALFLFLASYSLLPRKQLDHRGSTETTLALVPAPPTRPSVQVPDFCPTSITGQKSTKLACCRWSSKVLTSVLHSSCKDVCVCKMGPFLYLILHVTKVLSNPKHRLKMALKRFLNEALLRAREFASPEVLD